MFPFIIDNQREKLFVPFVLSENLVNKGLQGIPDFRVLLLPRIPNIIGIACPFSESVSC